MLSLLSGQKGTCAELLKSVYTTTPHLLPQSHFKFMNHCCIYNSVAFVLTAQRGLFVFKKLIIIIDGAKLTGIFEAVIHQCTCMHLVAFFYVENGFAFSVY